MPVDIRDPIRVPYRVPFRVHSVFGMLCNCFGERAMSLEVVRYQLPCTCI